MGTKKTNKKLLNQVNKYFNRKKKEPSKEELKEAAMELESINNHDEAIQQLQDSIISSVGVPKKYINTPSYSPYDTNVLSEYGCKQTFEKTEYQKELEERMKIKEVLDILSDKKINDQSDASCFAKEYDDFSSYMDESKYNNSVNGIFYMGVLESIKFVVEDFYNKISKQDLTIDEKVLQFMDEFASKYCDFKFLKTVKTLEGTTIYYYMMMVEEIKPVYILIVKNTEKDILKAEVIGNTSDKIEEYDYIRNITQS